MSLLPKSPAGRRIGLDLASMGHAGERRRRALDPVPPSRLAKSVRPAAERRLEPRVQPPDRLFVGVDPLEMALRIPLGAGRHHHDIDAGRLVLVRIGPGIGMALEGLLQPGLGLLAGEGPLDRHPETEDVVGGRPLRSLPRRRDVGDFLRADHHRPVLPLERQLAVMALIAEQGGGACWPGPVARELDHGRLSAIGEVRLCQQRRARRPSGPADRRKRGRMDRAKRGGSRPPAPTEIRRRPSRRAGPPRRPRPIHLQFVAPAARNHTGIGKAARRSTEHRVPAERNRSRRPARQMAVDRGRNAGPRHAGDRAHDDAASTAATARACDRPASDE